MDKRYQVFVSSTFADLQGERQEVMQALLELDCIPSGMELFPAANEDQWTLIKKVIDDCDYYMVILGGRYGSIGPEGLSYTEMEYRYALEKGKPILGFVHKDPSKILISKSEQSDEGRQKLSEFRDFVQTRMCRFWDSPADLGSQVSRSLVKLIKAHPAIGWVRGDEVPSEGATAEILSLRRTVEELERKLTAAATKAPDEAKALAQGDDEVSLGYTFIHASSGYRHDGTTYGDECVLTWDEIFSSLAPLMIDESDEATLMSSLNGLIRSKERPLLLKNKDYRVGKLLDFTVRKDDFQTVKIQLRALGLITKNTKSRSVKDTATYWTLTPYGDNKMTQLRAIPRPTQ
ncbi:hypothetical protein GGR59_003697 [Xanthomonas arboricola]|uniref:DUF4062 domain-containing protein n=1 Tax=Xanthomonas arboricola TaxID=56448 RepID=UPI001613D52F|nr:DUF4062 domain-containing protein [Xanthomonas arboricola]MBB4607413.1 hypothetical protein [Xanthomonas arboricola]